MYYSMEGTLLRTILIWAYRLVFAVTWIVLSCQGNITRANTKDAPNGVRCIVIDPGHGGVDKGTTFGTIEEKEITLNIALKLGELLKKNLPDCKVIFTRTSNAFVSLEDRAATANLAQANLFISIHTNFSEHPEIHGSEIFIPQTYPKIAKGLPPQKRKQLSFLFAETLQEQINHTANRKSRDIKHADFVVLKMIKMPAVLIETGFISNTKERYFLSSKDGINKLAQAMYQAILRYKTVLEKPPYLPTIAYFSASPGTDNTPTNAPSSGTTGTETPTDISTKPTSQPLTQESQVDSVFTIQVFALTTHKLPPEEAFKNLYQVYRTEDADFFRYYTGTFESREHAESELLKIRKKYPSAFIVYLNKQRLISVKNLDDNSQ